MPASWRIVPLSREHERRHFDCGEPALNDYLVRYARQHQDAGLARSFVAVDEHDPATVIGYHSLTVGGIEKANLPPAIAQRLPRFPVPIVRLARLAVDLGSQGIGLGEDLLIDALQRCLKVEPDVGVMALLIDAKDERARGFYQRYEFESLPDQPLTLWLPNARHSAYVGLTA